LPLEARRAAWTRLWQILLREPHHEDLEQERSEPGSEPAEIDDDAALVVPRRQVRR
jgi:hypothetical protein